MNAKLACAIAACAIAAAAFGLTLSTAAHPRDPVPHNKASADAAAGTASADPAQTESEPAASQQREPVAIPPMTAEGTDSAPRLRIVDAAGAPLPGAEYFTGELPSPSMGGLLVCEALREY